MTAPAMDPAGVSDTSLTPHTHPPQMFDELYSLGPARPPAMPAFNASIFSSQIKVGPSGHLHCVMRVRSREFRLTAVQLPRGLGRLPFRVLVCVCVPRSPLSVSGVRREQRMP